MDAAAAGGLVLAVMVVAVLMGLLSTVFWVWSLVDAVRRPDVQWANAAENKVLWVLLIVVLGVFGSLLYVVVPRPRLKKVAFHTPYGASFDPTAFGVPDGGLAYRDGGFQPRQ